MATAKAVVAQPRRQPRPGTFGHGGLGGHISFGDAAAKMGFAYTMNLCVGGARAPGPRL